MRKYFGTDGIRGKAGIYPMTPDFILKLGYAIGRVLAGEGNRVLIGKDTRISSYMFESALEAGLTYAGVRVALIGPMPTPGIAYLTSTLDTEAGCVVSASHNSYEDNGIKFFDGNGLKLTDEMEKSIEAMLEKPMISASPDKIGRVRRISDAPGRYIEFCKGSVNRLSLKGLRIVLDCAHGATYHIAPNVFKELGAEVIPMGIDPTGFNINRNVGSTSPQALINKVCEVRADCGIAFDGDGDRLVIVDHEGTLFDGDDILYLLARHRQERTVVGTVMSNLGFEKALNTHGIDLIRTKVGDRYVLEALNKHNLTLGGENSGHILCLDKHTTGDGIIAALQSLQALNELKTTFAAIHNEIPKTIQVMINVPIDRGKSWETDALKKGIEAVEKRLSTKGRVLIRPSGTEPLVRVMVEGQNESLLHKEARYLAGILQDS